jgi:glucose/mannose-6-phosphate isomerase
MMAFAQAFPELNHNELVGAAFAGQADVRWSCVYLRSASENPRNGRRAEVTKNILDRKFEVHEVRSRGESLLENILCLVLFGDFVSLYLSVVNKVDPAEIDAIHFLKKALAGSR